MAVLTDYSGRTIRLTDERWTHISEHPEMAGMRRALEETLQAPSVVVESLSDPTARLYHRFYTRTVVGEKYLCVVVKFSAEDAFVVMTMVITIACLGLRVCELLGLQWGDIDFEKLTVKVQRSFVEGEIYPTKTEASASELPLDPDLAGR